MQYALLIYEDEAVYGYDKNADAMRDIVSQHMAFSQGLGAKRVGGSGLKATTSATTVRTKDGSKTVHDGPFAEAREQLGGFYLVDVPDLDAAIEVAKRIPLYRDGSIEIRPVLGPG